MIEFTYGADLLVTNVAYRHLAARPIERRLTVYLAARFSRKEELAGYAFHLEEMGFRLTSRWLTGAHDWDNDRGPMPIEVQARFAAEDTRDIYESDLFVTFTEAPGVAGKARGGRHVELGKAQARNIPILGIGPIENVFYAMGSVHMVDTWADALPILERMPDALTSAEGRAMARMADLAGVPDPGTLELTRGTS